MIINDRCHINELIPETSSGHIFLTDVVSLGNSLPVVGMSVFSTGSHGIYLKYFTVRNKEKKEGREAGFAMKL